MDKICKHLQVASRDREVGIRRGKDSLSEDL